MCLLSMRVHKVQFNSLVLPDLSIKIKKNSKLKKAHTKLKSKCIILEIGHIVKYHGPHLPTLLTL